MRTRILRRRSACLAAALVTLLTVVAPAAAAPTPPVDTAGMSVLGGNLIVRPDGHRTRLALPRGFDAVNGVQIPAGFLITVVGPKAVAIWLFPHTGRPRRIGTGDIFGNWDVTHDGRYLLATTPPRADGMASGIFAAYAIPSLARRGQVRFDATPAIGPRIVGTAGDRVVLTGPEGPPGSAIAAVWDLRTGVLHRTRTFSRTWGVARDGHVLHRVDRYGPKGWRAIDIASACVDIVAITPAGDLPVGHTGLCTPVAKGLVDGLISPDGAWAVLEQERRTAGSRVALVRTADLHAGRWRPRWLNVGAAVTQFWDTDRSVLLAGGADTWLWRCDVTGRCAKLTPPRVPGVEPSFIAPLERIGLP